MAEAHAGRRYRFGVFEADAETGELRRKGLRVKLHAQPFQILLLLLERPGEMLTREEICRVLWPEGTFVDYEHGVNSAVNRLREALGDKAANPRFVETLARRGYRFVAPVERVGGELAVVAEPLADVRPGLMQGMLAAPEDLPQSAHHVVRTLFVLLQLMYLGYYVGALANLAEINELFSPLPYATEAFLAMVITAALLIPVRIFLLSAVAFRAPAMRQQFLRMWWGAAAVRPAVGASTVSAAAPYSVGAGRGLYDAAGVFAVCAAVAGVDGGGGPGGNRTVVEKQIPEEMTARKASASADSLRE